MSAEVALIIAAAIVAISSLWFMTKLLTEDEMARTTRIYEVTAGFTTKEGRLEERTFLVDAPSAAAAWRCVAKKFVGKPALPSGRRVAELVGADIKPEAVGE